jgi:hypothetical protein
MLQPDKFLATNPDALTKLLKPKVTVLCDLVMIADLKPTTVNWSSLADKKAFTG